MKAEYWINSKYRKAAPVGAHSVPVLSFVAASSLFFRIAINSPGGRVFVWPFVIAYLLFCPAVGCALYSLVFESPKRFAAVALVLAVFATFAFPLMADALLLIPFALLGVMGIVKFARWRIEKSQPQLPHSTG